MVFFSHRCVIAGHTFEGIDKARLQVVQALHLDNFTHDAIVFQRSHHVEMYSLRALRDERVRRADDEVSIFVERIEHVAIVFTPHSGTPRVVLPTRALNSLSAH